MVVGRALFDRPREAVRSPGTEPPAASRRIRPMKERGHTRATVRRAGSAARPVDEGRPRAPVRRGPRGDRRARRRDRLRRSCTTASAGSPTASRSASLRDDRLAEDAVQEGFLAVWRSAATFRADRAKASTWIVTLVHRRAVDLVRREERRRAEPLDLEQRDAPDRRARPRTRPGSGSSASASSGCCGRSPTHSARRSSSPTTAATRSPSSPRGSECRSGTIKSRMFAGLARLRELLDDTESEGSWTPRLTS